VAIDRIEVAAGPASAVHGSDALGGVVNVITRAGAHAAASVAAGEHGFAGAQASVSGRLLPAGWTVAGWGSRSRGFTFDRDFAQGGAFVRGAPITGLTGDVRPQRRAFGANGFYGPSPSKEWTDQSLLRGTYTALAGEWSVDVGGTYRRHHDRFRWDINRPGFAENTHQSDAVDATAAARRGFASTRLVFGAGSGGDWIDSSNLGDRSYARGFGFVETQTALPGGSTVQAGLRFDRYSRFGSAWSPTISASTHVGPRLKLRGSVGHAFRVPTFTELYYTDPAHQATADLVPERGWAIDAGLDWTEERWMLSATSFARRDRDVIDWVRATPADRWQTTNTRRVRTDGIEVTGMRRWAAAWLRASYTRLQVRPEQLTLLSKYVLEYAPHSFTASATAPLVAGVRAAATVDHRTRVDGQSYELVHVRVSRRIARLDLFADVSNLLDTAYVEVPGVAMPGRWWSFGVSMR
jgi:iron complex outermembrane receptor protein